MSVAKVLLNHPAQSDLELTLKVGDIITNIVKKEKLWWKGELRGRRGRFSCLLVEEIERNSGVARVLLDRPAQSDLELSLKEGDIIINIDKKEKLWWEGELRGRRGRFSCLLVEEIEKNKPPVAKKQKKRATWGGIGLGKIKVACSSLKIFKRKPEKSCVHEEADIYETVDSPILAKVMFDHHANEDDELSIRKGDIVEVLAHAQEYEGWWTGLLNGKEGFFPSNYVKLEKSSISIPEPQCASVSIPPAHEEPVLAKVMFDHLANEDDELSIRKGDIVEVLAQEHEGWWTGLLNGKEGFFPSNYVKLEKSSISIPEPQCPSVSIPPAHEEPVLAKVVSAVFDDVEENYACPGVEDIYDLPLEKESSPSNSVDLEDESSISIHKSEPTPVPIAPANEELVLAKVMFDYDAGSADELSLREGELVEVLDQQDNGWWKGALNGKEGLFPSNYVELEKGSVSIPKFQPTSVPIAPAKAEPVLAKVVSDDEEGYIVPNLENELLSSQYVNLGKGLRSIPKSQRAPVPIPPAKQEPGEQLEALKKVNVKNHILWAPDQDKHTILAKVMFDHHANEDDELSIRKGDIVEVLAQEHEGWWTGSLNGKEGFFPSNHVKLEKSPITIPKPQRASVSIPPVHEESVVAKVVDDYDAEYEDELSLKKGELVEVLDQEDTDWWKGALNGKVGLFPSNFVKLQKGSVSIPKSEPAPVPIAPPTNEEPEPSSQLIWIENSKTHREKFQKLLEYAQKHPEEIRNINGVRVCFENEFVIGHGADGTRVYIGLAEDGYEKAVKRILKSGILETLAVNEKKILNSPNIVNSKHVVNYWYYDEQSDSNFAFLILDLHEETLKDYVKAQSQEILTANAPAITRQILEGLNDLHGTMKPILHRDLKPSNILRNVQGDWILADFGISRMLPEGQATHRSEESGTPFWRAVESYPPENNNDKSDNESTKFDNESTTSDNKGRYKKQSDVQAAGMVSFYISTKGKHPFGSEVDRLRNLLGGNPVGLDNLADLLAKDLISWMLRHHPKDRPYAHEALKHPYLQPPDQQFELLKCVGNELEIKAGDTNCDVANEINTDPLLPTSGWKSQIHVDVWRHVCGRRPYRGDKWTQCLRFIRNTAVHWKDQTPPATVQNEVGEPQDYFLKLFPTLAVVVHRVIRNKEDWKQRKDLKRFF